MDEDLSVVRGVEGGLGWNHGWKFVEVIKVDANCPLNANFPLYFLSMYKQQDEQTTEE